MMADTHDTPNASPPDPDPMALARYLSGESEPAERLAIEQWIAASSEHRAVVEAMRAVWSRPPAAEFDPDDAVWSRIKQQIDAPRSRPALVAEDRGATRPAPSFQLGGRKGSWLAAAAVLAIVVGGALAARQVLERAATPVRGPVALREITTRRGERTVLNLGDGTRVVLGPASRLQVPADLGTHPRLARDLTLDGEAYFQVVHDSTRPFRVHTKAGVAEDIGTEYVVTTYPEVRGMRVVVASGAVVVRAGASQPAVTLAPGDLATVGVGGTATLTHGVDLARYVSWARGTLVFDGTRLSEALPALARWYDIDLRLSDQSLSDLKLTATFRDEPVSQVLELIGLSLDLAATRQGRTVTLRPIGSR
jgi:transmembrane sensor